MLHFYSGADLYKRLQPYILTEEQLKENNFPQPDPTKGGMAVFHGEERCSQKGSTKGIYSSEVTSVKVDEIYR